MLAAELWLSNIAGGLMAHRRVSRSTQRPFTPIKRETYIPDQDHSENITGGVGGGFCQDFAICQGGGGGGGVAPRFCQFSSSRWSAPILQNTNYQKTLKQLK